jgi:predicted HAD superfamily Cof-like phosphohydrolase
MCEAEDYPEVSGKVKERTTDGFQAESWYQDCSEFTNLYLAKTGKTVSGKIDREFVIKMVGDEMQELREAGDIAEEIDAIMDATYYMLQHLSTTGLPDSCIQKIWSHIHQANMTKFGEGGWMREDGKWMKPADFSPPDDKIRDTLLEYLTPEK